MSGAEGRAPARAALAGNPSDGFGGAVLAVALERLEARARATPGDGLSVSPPAPLALATARRFAREHVPGGLGATVVWETSIPRAVGLGGSSAIAIAVARALAGLCGVDLEPSRLAELSLAVEREDLGIAAGLQDRVAQAHGGLTFMDFGRVPHVYERLDPGLLAPWLVAWRMDAAGPSDRVHAPLRERFEQGEPGVVEAMARLGELAREARAALPAGDRETFARCVDGSLDARSAVLVLDPRHVAMVRCAREAGAAANYAGSGGAIVAVCTDAYHRARVASALARIGCATLAG